MKDGKKLYLTSGYSIQGFYCHEIDLHNLAICGTRGGYIGLLKYRSEDIDKIIGALKGALPAEGEPT